MDRSLNNDPSQLDVVLVGAGVVGQAILTAHLAAGIASQIADVDEAALDCVIDRLSLDTDDWTVSPLAPLGGELPMIELRPGTASVANSAAKTSHKVGAARIVIESIAERLDVKQRFFAKAEGWFDDQTLFCSNTSTLKLESIAARLNHPERLCGLHFFMPVDQRGAVEVIPSQQTDRAVVEACCGHAERLGKTPLIVADRPGFVVNRMLSPYLNQALLLITQGASAHQLEAAAKAFGMPMSPLELIDWIGPRTAFDAGRVYWQSFPHRMDPAPVLAALIKGGRNGRNGGGFYDYEDGIRSTALAPQAVEYCARYARHQRRFSDDDVLHLLTIPMWIEASCVLADRVVETSDEIELAMAGGLGFQRAGRWFEFFDRLGLSTIVEAVDRWSGDYRSMIPPPALRSAMQVSKTAAGCPSPNRNGERGGSA